MQKIADFSEFVKLSPAAPVQATRHGWRAKCLQRLIRLDLPVPTTVALPVETVRAIAAGQMPDTGRIAAVFGSDFLVSVRSSPENPEWGGPGTVLNVGMNDAMHARLSDSHGREAADALYLRFVQSYATHVARLDPDMFHAGPGEGALAAALSAYHAETDEPFPQDPARQLAEVLRSMARAWEGTTARLLRQAKGAPPDAVLGLLVQRMALGIGPGISGSGTMQFVDSVTGAPRIMGRFRGQSQGRAISDDTLFLTRDPRGLSLEELAPEIFAVLCGYGSACRARLREEMQLEFAIEGGRISVIDAVRVARSARATVKIAVALAEDGIITREDALLRVEPRALTELLH